MQSANNVLVTSSTFPLEVGDTIPHFVLDLANGLSDQFDSVHALTPGHPGAALRVKMKNVTVHRYRYATPEHWQVLCYREGMVQNVRRYPLSWFLIPQFIGYQVAAIKRICREHNITTVNSHWLVFQGLAGALARDKSRFRHVVHVHAAGLYVLLRIPRVIGRAIARFIITRSDHVICESNYVKSKLDELLGQPSGASVSCMGVDGSKFTFSSAGSESMNILFVGRMVEKKGIEYLLKAMPLLNKTIPEARLRIVGGGLLEDSLKALSSSLDLGDSVQFLGPRSHAEISKLQTESKVVTVPSIIDSRGETEGMPTVILEAMSAGKRVVASRVNGTPDVVRHNENGWLCNPMDPEDLASKLEIALRDKGDRIPLAAREAGEHYDWTNLCKRYATFLCKGGSAQNEA